jgi:hypothetical protein
MPEHNALLRCSESKYAVLYVPTDPMIYYESVEESRWSVADISLLVNPEDHRDFSFLSRLQRGEKIIVAYKFGAALCRISDRISLTKQGRSQVEVKFVIDESDFTPSMEVGFSSTSADKLAELRARRLLLNENPASESRDINAVTRELFLAGMDTALRIERSPFPGMFQIFGNNPERFLQVSWILAVMQLKLSACVEQVEQLVLTLQNSNLFVDFSGKRKKKYQNEPAYEIRFKGTCVLVA